MAYSKVIFNGTTLMDVTQDTVAAGNLLQGETATGADGEQVVGAYVPSGGSVPEVEHGVQFIDYDGTLVETWPTADVAGKTALPSNPSHTGLDAQGWNWTLADIKTYIASYPRAILTVGQSYKTTSGATEIDCTFGSDTLSPYLGIAPNGTVVVDWGDGSATTTLTGTSLTTLKWASHTYSAAGNYTIKLTPSSGSFSFYCSNAGYGGVLTFKNSFSQSWLYSMCINAIRMSLNATLGNYALVGLVNLAYISLTTSCTTMGTSVFQNCYYLQALTVPSGTSSIGQNAFFSCGVMRYLSLPKSVTSMGNGSTRYMYLLKSIAIPPSVTSLGQYAFHNANSLENVTLPSGLTTLGTYAFQNAYTLKELAIPSGVTSIGTYIAQTACRLQEVTFPGATSIGANAFQYDYAIKRLTIPSTVTSIGGNAFYDCRTLEKIRFERATPPTVSASSAFTNVNTWCVISVPVGSLNSYKTASNYPSSSSYTYIEEA